MSGKMEKSLKLFISICLGGLVSLSILIAIGGCSQIAAQKIKESMKRSEENIKELNKGPENEKIVKKLSDLLISAKEALKNQEINKALEITKKVEILIKEIDKDSDLRKCALVQLRKAKERYERVKKSGAELQCKDIMLRAKAEITKAEARIIAGDLSESIEHSADSEELSKMALEKFKNGRN